MSLLFLFMLSFVTTMTTGIISNFFTVVVLTPLDFFWDYFEYGILIGYSSMNSVKKNINENFMMLC